MTQDTIMPTMNSEANLYPTLPDIQSMDISSHESTSLLVNGRSRTDFANGVEMSDSHST